MKMSKDDAEVDEINAKKVKNNHFKHEEEIINLIVEKGLNFIITNKGVYRINALGNGLTRLSIDH